MMEEQTLRFGTGSGGSPALGRPVVNAVTGLETTELIAAPGTFAGKVDISASNKFYGAEANTFGCLYSGAMFSVDLLGGFRFLGLEEDLRIAQQTQPLGAAAPGSTTGLLVSPGGTAANDAFRTSNQFYGGQLGGQMEFRRANVFLTCVGKIALGSTVQVFDVSGFSVTGAGVSPGGLLALPSNSGRHVQNRLTYIPEGDLTMGVQLTPGLRVYCGYNFMYWSDVARPGNVPDRRVNPSQVPTSPTFGGGGLGAPAFTFTHSDFWAQGLNIGMAFRY
jgi:hypothetical protein